VRLRPQRAPEATPSRTRQGKDPSRWNRRLVRAPHHLKSREGRAAEWASKRSGYAPLRSDRSEEEREPTRNAERPGEGRSTRQLPRDKEGASSLAAILPDLSAARQKEKEPGRPSASIFGGNGGSTLGEMGVRRVPRIPEDHCANSTFLGAGAQLASPASAVRDALRRRGRRSRTSDRAQGDHPNAILGSTVAECRQRGRPDALRPERRTSHAPEILRRKSLSPANPEGPRELNRLSHKWARTGQAGRVEA
jgi:hypothetical protein